MGFDKPRSQTRKVDSLASPGSGMSIFLGIGIFAIKDETCSGGSEASTMQQRWKEAGVERGEAHWIITSLQIYLLYSFMCVCHTSLQDLLNLDVVGAEAAVELEVIGIVEEGSPKRKQQLL